MATETRTRYITVTDNPDEWGEVRNGFDHSAEADKIRDAVRAAGGRIEVYASQPPDAEQRDEIDWFSEWCTEGYLWSGERWREWFAGKV